MGRGLAFLGDRRRFSSLHRDPSIRPLLQLTTLLLAFGLVALAPSAASAQSPEIVLAVDGSESMQYIIGRDVAPDCIDAAPPRTRWNFILELLLGGQPGYKCTEESLASHPDEVSPPAQGFGQPTCIGGVGQTLASYYAMAPDPAETVPISDRSWAGGASTSTWEMRLQTDDSDMRLPYLSLDTASISDTDEWITGSVTLYTKDATGALPLDRWVYLAQANLPVSQATAKDWVCGVNGSSRVIVSEPAKVAVVAGAATTFKLTAAFAKSLRQAKLAGKTKVHLAVVPVDNWMKADCSGREGKIGTKFDVVFHGPKATGGKAPKYIVGAGKECPREGPGKHFAPKGPRDSDGLLDVFGSAAKFALFAPDSVMSASVGSAGGYSYGPSVTSLWGPINIGVASPFVPAGHSVRMPSAESATVRAVTIEAIKSALTNIRPSGGTPLGRMMEDIYEYMAGPNKDPHFQSLQDDPVNGDPYYECRERKVILFSDGGSNLDDGVTDSRQLAVNLAAALYAQGISVHVVAVGHDGKGEADAPSADDLALLDAIALAGGTTAALRPEDTTAFSAAMKSILGAAQLTGQVGTRSVWTEATGDPLDVQHTAQAKSYFDGAEPIGTRGIIEQRLQSCSKACVDPANPSTAAVCAVINYEDRLNDRVSGRSLYTMVQGTRYKFDVTSVGIDALQIPTFGQAPRLKLDQAGNCVTEPNTFDLSDSTQREQYRKELIALVRSESNTCREKKPLGAVGNAQPAFLDPADQIPLSDPVFKTYLATKTPSNFGFSTLNPAGSYQRPTMLFAATHDGQLHAFRTDRTKTITVKDSLSAGDEMWSWIPGFSLRRLRELKLVSTPQESLLGGKILATHALLERKISAVAEAALEWRAVVLVGAGEAGSGYAALDVTAPDDPQLMWEITPDQHCWGPKVTLSGVSGPKCAAVGTFVGMGRSTARPVLARAYYDDNGTKVERTVAIIAAGKPASASSVSNVGVDGNGERSIYIVELASGRLVRKLTDADIDTSGITTPISGKADLGHYWTEPACYNTAPGAYVSRCFIGDSKGMLWRVELSDPDPTKWKIEFFDDAYSGTDTPTLWVRPIVSPDRVPILSAPSLANARNGTLVVVYGTGNVDESVSVTRRHIAYSTSEKFTLNGSGAAAKAVADRNWVKAFDAATHFVGPPLVFSGDAYWATYTESLSGLCSVGVARLWGARFDEAKSSTDPTSLFGAFPNPAAPSVSSKNLTEQVIGSYVPSAVEITPVPSCLEGCGPTDTNCLIAKGGALGAAATKYQLTVASASQAQATGQKPSTGTQPAVGTAARTLAPPRSTSVITGWSLIYD